MLFLSERDIQRFLNANGSDLKVDGIIGKQTMAAMYNLLKHYGGTEYYGWNKVRRLTAFQQLFLSLAGFSPGAIDGLMGPNTRYAIELYQNSLRDETSTFGAQVNAWPADSGASRFFGAPGTNLVSLDLPYPMVLAWNLDYTITKFSINQMCRDSARRVLVNVLKHYKMDNIKKLGLNLFAGCYNNRNKRGGRSKSTHAYGAAIDFDSEHNQFRWNSSKARFAKSDYDAWWGFWEEEGWVSLGRERNYDWMHVQAVTL